MADLKKRLTAFMCAATMVVSSLTVTSTVTVDAKCLEGLTDIGREVAAEGCVLIKNEDDVLPLEKGVKISVFGRAQCNYYKSGTGSGGDVKVPYTTGILEGLRKNPKVKVNEELAEIYTEWVADGHGFDNGGGGWAAEPWYQAEMPLDKEVAEEAAEESDVAVVLIGRTAGEDKDGANTAGSYLLTPTEKDMLKVVTDTFENVVVVLNVPAIIDMNWMNDYKIDSVLYAWQGGMSGGDAVADVLTGDVNPSGRLTDTIANNYSDYPSASNFGSTEFNFYEEDIYVGYRYFETFAPEKVAYPFGYGLSYTTFETSTYSVTETDGNINVFVTVENTGKRAGKETVQVYYGAPQGELGNPAKELAAFAKTKLLQPGEAQDIVLSFRIDDMASYDDGNYTGHDSAYVLEAGDYKVYAGNDVRNSELVYTYHKDELEVVEQLSEQMAPIVAFDRFKAVEEGGKIVLSSEETPLQDVYVPEKIKDNLPEELEVKDEKHYDLIDVYNDEVTVEEFVAQMTNEELISIVQGEGMSPEGVTPGVAAAFGGVSTTKDGEKTTLTELYGIPRAAAADGPSGIRQTAAATSIPGGAAIACTWNLDLVEKLLKKQGEEMILNNIDTILGPGINIHRNPLNGRNFEYYSEDPLLTGKMAAAVTKGIQSTGATVTLKHFAANNQETNRHKVDSRVSERALREIYLKCFEIAVKEGNARSVMTAYNPVNGCWTASNYDLTTEILRKEWGYEGIVMSDWWAEMNETIGDGTKTTNGVQYLASMVKAQNDIYMVTPDSSTELAANTGNTLDMAQRLEEGYITRAELQRSAVNICKYLLKSQCFATLNNMEFKPSYQSGEEWFTVEKSEPGNPALSGITVGERKIAAFHPDVREYKVYSQLEADPYNPYDPYHPQGLPEVSAEAASGKIRLIEQATTDSPVAKIYVNDGGEEVIYRVIFTDEEGLPTIFEDALDAALSDIKLNGDTIEGFDSSVYDYSIPLDSLEGEPDITFTAPAYVEASKTYNAKENLVTIQCTTADQVKYYRIRFGIRPQSDEFNESTLSSFWTNENESAGKWSLENGHLVINTETGSTYQTENNIKNQFSQSAFGDWEVEAKLDLSKLPWSNYQSIGIVAKQDDDNYIYLKTEHGGDAEISFTEEVNGTRNVLEEISATDLAKFNGDDISIYFRLKKIGNTYTASVSPDGEEFIKFGPSASGAYTNPKFALVAGNGSDTSCESIAAMFDYVRFNYDVSVPVVTIGDSTKLKVAEAEPLEISSVMKAETCEDEDGGKSFGNCAQGEYAVYNVNVEKSGIYEFSARVASNESETAQVKFTILLDDKELTSFYTSGTGGWQEWVTSDKKQVRLTAGQHTYKVYFNMAGMNLNWIQMDLKTEINDADLKNKVEEAKEMDVSAYPQTRQQALKAAIADAEKAISSAMTQEEVDGALASLNTAIDKLPVKTAISKITVDNETVYLNPGKSVKITPTVSPKDYTEELVWSSSNEDTAVVDDGVITAVKEGTAIITVSNGDKVNTTVRVVVKAYTPVKAVPMTSIKLSASALSLQPGSSISLSATPAPVNTTETITWSSSNEKVAKVVNGLVTAVAEGSAKITASNGNGVTAVAVITVSKTADKNSYLNGVEASCNKKTLYVGGNKDTNAQVSVEVPAGAAIASVDYHSSNPKAAVVNIAGKVTAKAKGNTKITAKVTLTNGESKEYTFDVAVKKAYIKATSVPKTIKKGKSKTLKAKAYGSSKKITWKITKGAKYAKITKKGKLTAKKKGTVKVTATSGKIKKTFTVKIK